MADTTLTITLSAELKQQLQAYPEVDWSAFAITCFEHELAARNKSLDLHQAAKRLSASRQAAMTDQQKAGYLAGRSWATNVAEWGELECTANLAARRQQQTEYQQLDLDQLIHALIECSRGGVNASIPKLLDDLTGLGETYPGYQDTSFFDSFLRGATEIYQQIQQKI